MLWSLKSFLVITLLASLAISITADSRTHYPTYVWSQGIKGKKTEEKSVLGTNGSMEGVQSSRVSEEIKNIIASTNANSFIVYHRTGMNTQGLVNTLVNSDKISKLLKESSRDALERSYTDVVGEPVVSTLSKTFENVQVRTVDSKESLEELKKEFEGAAKPFIHKYYIIELPYGNDASFDEVVFQIERAFAVRTLGNHVSAISGSPAEQRLLQEVDVEPTDESSSSASSENDDVYQYVTSNILTKTLVAIPIAFLLILAMLQMFYIKTPTLFVEKSIDFGKIEK